MVESQAVFLLVPPQIGEVTAAGRLGQSATVPQRNPVLKNFGSIAFVCFFSIITVMD
ncbi:MAG: hypothetical protein GQ542_10665 [Desulforhopalus sp.]|nr:hypothetical protein [Desulforhopalus sp.]